MSALTIEGLVKGFGGTPVLRGLDLAVAPGELVAILGASGSGKSTLLRLIAGFERAEAGTIALAGEVLAGPGRHRPPERRRIGYVAQDGALFPHLDVAENVLFGLPRAARAGRDAAARLLDLVGLPAGYAARDPASLSGGEQQRVALARTLAPGPRLVLLDEPFSALDAGARERTRRAVQAALRAAEATALLVTHDQAEALSLGDRVGILRDGRLARLAPPAELYRAPGDRAAALLTGEAVLLPGRSDGAGAETPLGRVALRGGARGPVTVLLRPEQIRRVGEGEGTEAAVLQASFQGPHTLVRLQVGRHEVLARLDGAEVPPPGARLWLAVAGEGCALPPEEG